jgi:hypothetical protein
LEHFANHEAIEITEAEREAIYQGITVEEALAQHRNPAASEEDPAQHANTDNQDAPKKIERPVPPEQQDPAVRFRQAKAESDAHGEWGAGEAGYKSPNTPSERMRKNVPYKVMSHLLCSESLLEVDVGTYAVQIPSELGRFLACRCRFSWKNLRLNKSARLVFIETSKGRFSIIYFMKSCRHDVWCDVVPIGSADYVS